MIPGAVCSPTRFTERVKSTRLELANEVSLWKSTFNIDPHLTQEIEAATAIQVAGPEKEKGSEVVLEGGTTTKIFPLYPPTLYSHPLQPLATLGVGPQCRHHHLLRRLLLLLHPSPNHLLLKTAPNQVGRQNDSFAHHLDLVLNYPQVVVVISLMLSQPQCKRTARCKPRRPTILTSKRIYKHYSTTIPPRSANSNPWPLPLKIRSCQLKNLSAIWPNLSLMVILQVKQLKSRRHHRLGTTAAKICSILILIPFH